MDYAKLIGNRLRTARKERDWTLEDVERESGGQIAKQALSRYERGERMLGHPEAVILAKTLGKRLAWIMAVDDTQTIISQLEERLVLLWRKLPENEREEVVQKLEIQAIKYSKAVPDQALQHFSAKGKPQPRRLHK